MLLKKHVFNVKACCDGHFLQCARCPTAARVLALYDNPSLREHRLHSKLFTNLCLDLNQTPDLPMHTSAPFPTPDDDASSLLMCRGMSLSSPILHKHKLPGKKMRWRGAKGKRNSAMHRPAGRSADTLQPPQSALHYRIHNRDGSFTAVSKY